MKTRETRIQVGGWQTRSILDCGGKSDATPLFGSGMAGGNLRRRFAPAFAWLRRGKLPEQSKTWRFALLLCFILLHSSFCLRAVGQSFSIDFFTIDGGGGTSTGGQFSVSGTIGQPDAGKLTGGQFTLDGGFWGIDAAVLVAGSPNLRIARTATNNLVIAWPLTVGTFQLQQNPTFGTVNWSNVNATVNVVGSENQVLVPRTLLGNRYRLQSQ